MGDVTVSHPLALAPRATHAMVVDMDTSPTDLTGKLLIAMPGMGDPRFDRAVIFICAHGADGTLGLIVNKPAPELSFAALLDQLSIPVGQSDNQALYFGGPVEGGRGFVLHSRDYTDNAATLKVDDRFGMTATLDILQDMTKDRGPRRALVMLGYAGWGGGQLESEIAQNGWLVADATPDLVFGSDDDGKWLAAITALGIDPIMLSGSGGRA